MKKIFPFLVAVLLTAGVFAQTPEKMSYQAVVRDNANQLVTNTEISVKFSILDDIEGTALWIETQMATTNANGLLTVELGSEVSLDASIFQNTPLFIKTEIDLEGGTDYTITGTSQLLSVPYAFYAKTAETVIGEITETDPVFESSPAFGIETSDIGNWNEAYGWGNHADQAYLTFTPDITSTSYQMQVIYPNVLFKGRLYDDGNKPIEGTLNITVKMYDTESGGTALWMETIETNLNSGYFTMELGQIASIPTNLFETYPKYLEIQIGGEILTDRVKLIKVSNSIYSDYSEVAQRLQGTSGMGDGSGLDADMLDGHDSSHFLTVDFDETDPTVPVHVKDISLDNITTWDNKQDQLTAGTGIDITNNVVSVKNDFYLGQDTLGGIVFYIYLNENGDQRGLIVSKTETTTQWQDPISTTNANRSWDGVYNMNLMSDSPAKDWVISNFSTEWYLPSIDELSILWHNRFHVNKALNDAGATLLSSTSFYWSSTENYATVVFSFDFWVGHATDLSKASFASVRAVRTF